MLLVVSVIISLGFANADTCSGGNDDTIMRLYSEGNSHGALWNESASFPTTICYNENFGSRETSSIHECVGDIENPDNVVLWLHGEESPLHLGDLEYYKAINSHASTTKDVLGYYNYPVCYGDLNCEEKGSEAECTAWGGKVIVSLSSSSNAHLAKGDLEEFGTKICCKKTEVAGALYWAAMDDERPSKSITTSNIGSSVKLIWNDIEGGSTGPGLVEGSIVQFEILEKDSLTPDDPIRKVTGIVNIVDTGELRAVAIWKITQEDFDKGADGLLEEIIEGDTLEFIFKVTGQTGLEESPELYVDKGSYENLPPYAKITFPSEFDEFVAGGAINFKQDCGDPDNDIEVVWDFADGSDEINIKKCLTTGNCDTTHTYTTDNYGTKIVKLKVLELDRGSDTQTDKDSIEIYIYRAGPNVFAVITEPLHGDIKNVPSNVWIDGSGSYVAKCLTSSEANCETEAASLGYAKAITPGDYCDTIDEPLGSSPLYCYKLDNEQGIPGEYKLQFDWSFSQGNQDNNDGVWVDFSPLSDSFKDYVRFTHIFTTAIEHWVGLKVGYVI